MVITLINNSCFILEICKKRILVDPYIDIKTLKAQVYDYVLISHAHIDHMFHLNKIEVPVIAPKELCFKKTDIPISKEILIDSIKIIPTKTIHPRWFQKNFLYDYLQSLIAVKRPIRCRNSFGYIIQVEGETLYYGGDTLYKRSLFEDIKNKYNPNICLIAFEEIQVPTMSLLVHINKINELESIFNAPIIPVHQTQKWYKKNFKKYVNLKNVMLTPTNKCKS